MKAKRNLFPVAAALFLAPFFIFSQGESTIMPSDKINLPDTIDGWRLEGPPRRIEKTNIFDYMNGAGELYLSYHFDHLLVYEYQDDSGNDILVELYFMKDSQDAFGLLSLDWGGETVELNFSGAGGAAESIVPPSRALYGQGLLRAWSDNLYIRILAFRESPGVRDVILKLGKLITAGRKNPSPPELLQVINPPVDFSWVIKRDRTAYFYSHMVLNSFFYISHENILNLNSYTEAVIVTFEKEKKDQKKHSVRLLVIKYPDDEHASTALTDFSNAYLPDKNREVKPERGVENQGFFHIEDGWLGYKLDDRYLAMVFECPDRESAREVLSRAVLK